ncbi:DUF481 domain-containing protein [Colwellia sp. D2M02]|uniref:DUF481 domain-containing protein n=1 Tax=Colwellia sp. D2M02 TaxID=2841562 RepID=UPI001C095279|nr:DUF481 domain-containing protein [Colwellia sp. D2M02]MBU2892109.1 DUF481 domain-containing protein [Colwellia sp. D2M02]
MHRFILFFLLFISFLPIDNLSAQEKETLPAWEKPTPVFLQKHDWLKLKSDEWLKGDIISMYDDELEFDSDEFGLETFDWEDVSELRSRYDQNIRFANGEVVKGFLIVHSNEVTLISNGTERKFPLSELMSITSAADSRRELWDVEISLGLDISSGNVNQLDYLFSAVAQRSTPYTRFKTEATYNYSKQTTNTNDQPIIDASRVTSSLDWFYNSQIFFRLFDYEYMSDFQQNIQARNSLGTSIGYHVVDNKRLQWDVTAGPSFQITSYEQSAAQADQKSAVLALSTLVEYTVSSRTDFIFDYSIQFVEEESGKRNSHLKTGFEFEFTDDFELDIMLYFDRVAHPVVSVDSVKPEPNDYQLYMSIGYNFY